MSERRPYRRESEERRREDLISAALELLAEGGPQAATVRAIGERAGVTAGLIRHYFDSKEDLTRAAYGRLMDGMTAYSAQALEAMPHDPLSRVAHFIAAAVSPPVVDPVRVGLWAGFVHELRRDDLLRAEHQTGYLRFRDRLQDLIEHLDPPPANPRAAAIACNGLVDGLWMEASLLPEAFAENEIVDIALNSAGAILNVDLWSAYKKNG